MRRTSFVSPLLLLLAVACTDDPSPPGGGQTRPDATIAADAAARLDATARTDASDPQPDAEVVVDSGVAADSGIADDATIPPDDAGTPPDDAVAVPDDATVTADAGPGPMDAAGPPYDGGATCEFLDLEIAIVPCANRLSYIRGWQDVNGTAGCLPYWTLEGGTYTSSTTAVAGAGCSAQCYYRAHMSVSFIDHCNRRNGYIVFRDEPNQAVCPDVYEFSNGLFPSRAAWEQDTPCAP